MIDKHSGNILKVKSLGIDSYRENIIFMRADCHICTSEGFKALTRVVVKSASNSIIATLNVVYSDILAENEAGLSLEALKRLGVNDGDEIEITHLNPVKSFQYVRGRMFGKAFSEQQLYDIIHDIVNGRYSNIELAAFITVCSNGNLSVNEIIYLTKAMLSAGRRLKWNAPFVLDKHSIGGLPGNRTTPIVVSIIAAAGYLIPKTSSRAITSPAGTADTVEVITNVTMDLEQIEHTVLLENGCLAWGGAIKLSPADDIIISVEKALDIDSEGQMVASVLSKKAAAGSTHVVIDIPIGETAKARTQPDAERLAALFEKVGKEIGLHVKVVFTNGTQPVGIGIGPVLEAMDVLSVLQNSANAPQDLKIKSVKLAQDLLDLVGSDKRALEILENGEAYKKFKAICLAQGEWKIPQFAKYSKEIKATKSGHVKSVNNRQIAKLAKLAGAPVSPAAGIQYFSSIGKKINKGDTLFTIWAEIPGELAYALDYLTSVPDIIKIN